MVVLTFHGCTFEVLIFRFLMTSKRRFLVRKREFRGDSLFILDLVLCFSHASSGFITSNRDEITNCQAIE